MAGLTGLSTAIAMFAGLRDVMHGMKHAAKLTVVVVCTTLKQFKQSFASPLAARPRLIQLAITICSACGDESFFLDCGGVEGMPPEARRAVNRAVCPLWCHALSRA